MIARKNLLPSGKLSWSLVEGEQSGPSTPFDFDRFLEAKRSQTPG